MAKESGHVSSSIHYYGAGDRIFRRILDVKSKASRHTRLRHQSTSGSVGNREPDVEGVTARSFRATGKGSGHDGENAPSIASHCVVAKAEASYQSFEQSECDRSTSTDTIPLHGRFVLCHSLTLWYLRDK